MEFIKLILCVSAIILFILVVVSLIDLIWNPTINNLKQFLAYLVLNFVISSIAHKAIKDEF